MSWSRAAAVQNILKLGAIVFDKADIFDQHVINKPRSVLGQHAVGHGNFFESFMVMTVRTSVRSPLGEETSPVYTTCSPL